MIVTDELQLTEAVLAETERADDPRVREIVQALVRQRSRRRSTATTTPCSTPTPSSA